MASLSYSQTSVVQRYVERPLCINGYKFDLRLFVVVTSFKPLEAFIYKGTPRRHGANPAPTLIANPAALAITCAQTDSLG